MSQTPPLTPGFDEFQQLCRKGNLVSVYTKLTADFETPLSAYRKIDNGVHIAHNVQIGRHSLILGQVGIAGSSVTGAYTILAGQSGILDHCILADRVTLGPKSVITKSAAEGEVVYGYPAIPYRDWQRQLIQQKNLSKLSDKVNKLWSWFQKQDL